MRLTGPSRPTTFQNQATILVGLVLLALLTAFAVFQAVEPTQNEETPDHVIAKRQMFGLPGLPVAVFGDTQVTSVAVVNTPLPVAAPPNNQPVGLDGFVGRIISTIVAPLAPAVGTAGSLPSTAVNLGSAVPVTVSSLLPVGSAPVPTIMDGQPPQLPNIGVTSLVPTLVSVVGGAATPVLAPILSNTGLPAVPIITGLESVLQGASIILPSAVSTELGGFTGVTAPQLPGATDIANSLASGVGVTSVAGFISVVRGSANPISTVELDDDNLCTVVNIANNIPTFLIVPCPPASTAVPQTAAGSASTPPANPPPSTAAAVVPSTIASQVTPVASTPAVAPSSAAPSGGSGTDSPRNDPSSQTGGGSQNNGQPQATTPPSVRPETPTPTAQQPVPTTPSGQQPQPAAPSAQSQSSQQAPNPSSAPAPGRSTSS